MYLDKDNKPTDKKPSTSGYGVYVNSHENYTSEACLEKDYWQYDFTKYLTFGTNTNIKFDKVKTSYLLKELLSVSTTEKLFIEPHLKKSLGFANNPKVKFHGCQAVRHDDHIHLQIK